MKFLIGNYVLRDRMASVKYDCLLTVSKVSSYLNCNTLYSKKMKKRFLGL